jgi:hypothetical protein
VRHGVHMTDEMHVKVVHMLCCNHMNTYTIWHIEENAAALLICTTMCAEMCLCHTSSSQWQLPACTHMVLHMYFFLNMLIKFADN